MDRIDKLIERARPKETIIDTLEKDNPWLGLSFDELVDMMTTERLPSDVFDRHKYNYAVMEAFYAEVKT